MQKYCEVRITCSMNVSETICSFLMEHGAQGAVEENVFVTGRNREDTSPVRGYFAHEEDFLAIKGDLKRFLDELKKNIPGFDKYRVVYKPLKGKNWCDGYKKHFKVIKVSERIVVKPDFRRYAPKRGERVITINPQMAFGIGNHPTTKMCIRYIDEILKERDDTTGVSLLDAGTGSGILSIAASLLGVDNVYGFDIDEVAVQTANENILKNGLAGRIRVGCHGIEKIGDKYDIIVANILSKTLIDIREDLLRVTAAGGNLILSGILLEQKDEVVKKIAGIKKVRTKLMSVKKDAEWVALHFIRLA